MRQNPPDRVRREALSRLAAVGFATAICPSAGLGAETAKSRFGIRDDVLPAWVPPPGTRRNISRNLLADVDPCPRRDCIYSGVVGQEAVLIAWCGGAFASAYGNLGAWITTGGGHGDYYGNEVYAFELDSRRWVRLNDPYPGGRDSSVDYR